MYGQLGNACADVESAEQLKGFFNIIQELLQQDKILAYHDRSDGGLLATLCEMAFASHAGLSVDISQLGDSVAGLFSEELGAVIQVKRSDLGLVQQRFSRLSIATYDLGGLSDDGQVRIAYQGEELLNESRVALEQAWAETSFRIQSIRDNSQCAQQEFDQIARADDPGLSPKLSFDPQDNICAPMINRGARPRVAILREQGVNGHIEMAGAFHKAGFDSVDVHMSEILSAGVALDSFSGLVACGGFSYGDVLGAGEGWAKSILFNPVARQQFQQFFQRSDVFALGVCNGCQMMSNLHELIPGADYWPHFVRNQSERFEARVSMVEVQQSNSILLQGMAGSRLPIAIAHGEGRAEFKNGDQLAQAQHANGIALRYVDNWGQATETYPANPNGSVEGVTGLTNADGRITIMMPHPERVYRTVQNSWYPSQWGEDGVWLRLFRNARAWLG